jgi:hypothetical protein
MNSGYIVRTLVGHWLGVVRHFALPCLWALVPGCDEDVHIFRPLQGLERKEDDIRFGCLKSYLVCMYSGETICDVYSYIGTL